MEPSIEKKLTELFLSNAELLDEGQSLYARVQDIDVHNRWAEISIDVYVEEQ